MKVTRSGAGRSPVSSRKDWGTPLAYVEAAREALGGRIDLDPCSNRWSLVGAATEYRLPVTDGLMASWDFPTIFVNPPYGADPERGTRISDWLARCAGAWRDHGSQVVALVPVATNTRHWREHVFGAARAVCFLSEPRVKFLNRGIPSPKGAPMACASVYWGGRPDLFRAAHSRHGAVVDLRA